MSCSIVYSLLVILALTCCISTSDDLEIHNTFQPTDCSRKARVTDILTLHYKGTLENGNVFDSSYERNEPFSFQLGIGQVIRGWDEGLIGMCEGEKRRLVVGPKKGYGDTAHDQIPAGSTLIFDVECLKVEDGPNPVNVFKEIDLDGDDKLSRHEVSQFLSHQLSHAVNSEGHNEEIGSMLEEVFQNEDKDKDGFITRDEFSGPKHDHEEL